MAWNETTREKFWRSSDRHESDLTDEELLLDRTDPLGSVEARTSPHCRSSGGFRRDPVHAGDGVPMVGDSQVFPAFTTVQNFLYAWPDLGDEEAGLPPKVA